MFATKTFFASHVCLSAFVVGGGLLVYVMVSEGFGLRSFGFALGRS